MTAPPSDTVPSPPLGPEALDRLTDSAQDALFAAPPRAGVPSAWYGHVPFAFWLVLALRPRLLVELGTHNGVSYAAFCEAVQQAGFDTRCFAVDTWQGDEQAGFYGEQVFAELSAFHDARYAGFSRLLRANFDDAAAHFADASIDLLHIDGCHTYEMVRHDFETWRPKLSSRAVVLFHDTNERVRDFGVWRLWAELRGQYPGFEFLHEHGLGVLAYGLDLDGPARDLCRLTNPATIARLRTRFAQSGSRCMADSEQSRLDKELQAVQYRLVNELPKALELKADAELALQEQAKKIHEALAETASVEREVASAGRELAYARREIERLALIAIANEKRAFDSRAMVGRVQHELRAARDELDSTGEDLARSQKELADTAQLVDSLRSEADRYKLIADSTLWRLLGPLRSAAGRLPQSARHGLLKGVRALWRTATPWRGAARRQWQRESATAISANRVMLPSPDDGAPAVAPDAVQSPPAPGVPSYLAMIQCYDPFSPEVSIIVRSRGSSASTLRCLERLWEFTSEYRYEIIVVDGASDTVDQERLRTQEPLIRLLSVDGRPTMLDVTTAGVEAAQGRYICLLSKEVKVGSGWLSPLIDQLADARTGAVVPASLAPASGDPVAAACLLVRTADVRDSPDLASTLRKLGARLAVARQVNAS